jgi:hydrogenase small subunit
MNTTASIAGDAEGKVERSRSMSDLDVLWTTAGLGCDGETIAMTAPMQPSIEDVGLVPFPESHE